jgi:hypothetical protein
LLSTVFTVIVGRDVNLRPMFTRLLCPSRRLEPLPTAIDTTDRTVIVGGDRKFISKHILLVNWPPPFDAVAIGR